MNEFMGKDIEELNRLLEKSISELPGLEDRPLIAKELQIELIKDAIEDAQEDK
jgi:hypothetical protein|tara:strand:- start:199 stop:357 length:159 start_codon:yes stop_codon:yes gene_type:complete